MKREIVGVDLDNVICNTSMFIDELLKNKFNLYLDWDNDFVCYDFVRNTSLTKYIGEYLVESVDNGTMFINSLPYGDVCEGLNLLKKENFYIDIITSRPNGKEHMTINWLKKYNIIYDDIYFSRARDKKHLARGLNMKAFVEDRFDILNMVLEECGSLAYGLMIIDHPWNRKFHNKHVDRVYSFMEACETIIKYKNGGH